jgi:hypothetical protein
MAIKRVYEITNTISGAGLGRYEVDSEGDALEAMAHDAGYADYAEKCRAAPVQPGELRLTLHSIVVPD